MISAYLAEYLPTAPDATVPFNPQRTVQTRDYGEIQWLQRDLRDANTVATAANPLVSPLDSAWQAGARYWHLYADAAGARTWQSVQRNYVSDPSLLGPAPTMPPPPPQRTVAVRDPGETQWQQAPRRDPQLLATAELENELLGGADTAKRYLAPATNAPRQWMPQQPKRDASTPGLLDSAELEGPLLAGDTRRQYAAGAYVDRREMPQQRPYLSDPSFYPTTAPTDPLTIAYGAGGTYWTLYNAAALLVDRRNVPQQRNYVSDPNLLLTALLEGGLLGSADTDRHRTWFVDRRTTAAQPRYPDPNLLAATSADPLAVAGGVGGDIWRRANTPAYADRRQTAAQPPRWTLYFDAGPGSPPLTLAWGAGGDLWHRYNPRRPARSWWPAQLVFPLSGDHACSTPRPLTGITGRPTSGTTAYALATTARPGTGTTTRPNTGITQDPC